MKVSVLLLTFNEEKNLPDCLASLSWCDDILVVDSGSTDRTLEIARNAGARVLHRPFDDFARQRNFGLDQGAVAHEWVLHLDADEVLTPEFITGLGQLSPPATVDAYRVPSKLILFGQWVRHAGMYPTYQVRLGHRDRLRFVQVGHGQREAVPAERVGCFDVPYLHYSFSGGMKVWLEKHVRYARDEARLIAQIRAGSMAQAPTEGGGAVGRRRRAKALAARLPLVLRPVARFFYIFVWRRGFLDGRAGLAYALMLSVYEGMIAIFGIENQHAVQGADAREKITRTASV